MNLEDFDYRIENENFDPETKQFQFTVHFRTPHPLGFVHVALNNKNLKRLKKAGLLGASWTSR